MQKLSLLYNIAPILSRGEAKISYFFGRPREFAAGELTTSGAAWYNFDSKLKYRQSEWIKENCYETAEQIH